MPKFIVVKYDGETVKILNQESKSYAAAADAARKEINSGGLKNPMGFCLIQKYDAGQGKILKQWAAGANMFAAELHLEQ